MTRLRPRAAGKRENNRALIKRSARSARSKTVRWRKPGTAWRGAVWHGTAQHSYSSLPACNYLPLFAAVKAFVTWCLRVLVVCKFAVGKLNLLTESINDRGIFVSDFQNFLPSARYRALRFVLPLERFWSLRNFFDFTARGDKYSRRRPRIAAPPKIFQLSTDFCKTREKLPRDVNLPYDQTLRSGPIE